jgi:hypothetical protein
VVIPLLRGYTVENGESRRVSGGYLAGRVRCGIVAQLSWGSGLPILAFTDQAFPGPNFNFAVYLGVLCNPSSPVLGAFLGWLGIFSPGILLKLALLPVPMPQHSTYPQSALILATILPYQNIPSEHTLDRLNLAPTVVQRQQRKLEQYSRCGQNKG